MEMTRPFASIEWGQIGPCDLRIKAACKRYESFSLNKVDLAVPQGSVVGLIGRNGAGKTTLMQLVIGSAHLDGGTVELFGHDIAALGPDELAELRQRMAYVSATIAYPAGMRGTDVARLYELAYPAFSREEFSRLCRAMELDAEGQRISELSRGMGMKLQLACALASGASLLLLDEPTAGLDPIVREEFLDILRSWMETGSRSVLISSHITSDLEGLADYLVMIDDGRVLASCEADIVSDVMGVASLRTAELERVVEKWPFGQTRPCVLRRDLGWQLLVPVRPTFRRLFPDLACDRLTIDDMMAFLVKGQDYREVR